jgi:hypothetical protein
MNMTKNDFQWDLMVAQLRGDIQFNEFGLHQVAQLSCGDVKEVQVHDLLTQRLYTPTAGERFDSI